MQALFELPFPELMHRAQLVHREHFDPMQVEFATLLSVKTGGCPEDCAYCPQAARFDTEVEASKLMEPAEVLQAAQRAKEAGATRFCMGARHAGLKVCCGGIVGMGESRQQRAGLIAQLAALDPYPESVPINHLVRVPGTPLAEQVPLDPFEFVRTIAAARITMPKARVRLSAGRQQMGDAVQALCFLAGANSIFYGDKLLTTGNPDVEADRQLLARLGLKTP